MSLLSCRFSQKTNKRICFSILNSSQDRKTNSFIHFLGESAAQQFCFEIYWPLVSSVANFDQFFYPSPSQLPTSLMAGPLRNLLKTHSSLSLFLFLFSLSTVVNLIICYILPINHLNVLKISCLTIKNRQNEVIKGFVCCWFGKGLSINDVVLREDDLVH